MNTEYVRRSEVGLRMVFLYFVVIYIHSYITEEDKLHVRVRIAHRREGARERGRLKGKEDFVKKEKRW